MKRIISLSIIFILLMLCTFSVSAIPSSSYSVEKVNIVAEMHKDGSVLVTEEWTLTVAQDCKDCFTREILVVDNNFEKIGAVSDISVSLDGNTCREENGDSLEDGTYFYEKSENAYSVMWYIPEAGTHTFSVRYLMADAVKIYKDRAYFYYRAVNEDSSIICRDVTVTINTPAMCYSEDFAVVEAGSLAGNKSDSSITFTAANTAGLVKTGISVPADLFNKNGLTVIVDDNRAELAGIVILVIVLFAVSGYLVYFSLNCKKITLERRLKQSRKNPVAEKLDVVQRRVFEEVSPSALLDAVLDGETNKSDYFIVTVIDLVSRGYIKAGANGFIASEKSDCDSYGRPLDANDKRVIRLFASGRWTDLVKSPVMFFNEIEDFNRHINRISPFADVAPKGKKLMSYCFELRLSAKRYEFVPPSEISDTIFRSGGYTTGDLVVSLINEYDYAADAGIDNQSAEKFSYDMFMFRDICTEGEKLTLEAEREKEIARQLAKQKKKHGEDV